MISLKPENLEIETVEEGAFKEGLKDGYCRVMQAHDGSCEVGFFQKNVPMGKYCMYKQDGTYLLPEGLYEGQGQCKSKIEIANYMMQTAVRRERTKPRGGAKAKFENDGTPADFFNNFGDGGDGIDGGDYGVGGDYGDGGDAGGDYGGGDGGGDGGGGCGGGGCGGGGE